MDQVTSQRGGGLGYVILGWVRDRDRVRDRVKDRDRVRERG